MSARRGLALHSYPQPGQVWRRAGLGDDDSRDIMIVAMYMTDDEGWKYLIIYASHLSGPFPDEVNPVEVYALYLLTHYERVT